MTALWCAILAASAFCITSHDNRLADVSSSFEALHMGTHMRLVKLDCHNSAMIYQRPLIAIACHGVQDIGMCCMPVHVRHSMPCRRGNSNAVHQTLHDVWSRRPHDVSHAGCVGGDVPPVPCQQVWAGLRPLLYAPDRLHGEPIWDINGRAN